MEIINLQTPANAEQNLVASFVHASESIRNDAIQHKEACGDLRRTISELRESLKSCIGDLGESVTQVSIPDPDSTGTPLYARVKFYRSAKAITDQIVAEAACSVLGGVSIGAENWRQSVLDMLVEKVRADTITRKSYVDITSKAQKAQKAQKDAHLVSGNAASVSVDLDATVSRLALELQRVKNELKRLSDEHKQNVAAPKQNLERLRQAVGEHMQNKQMDRVRVSTPGDRADIFVGPRLSYQGKTKLTQKDFKALLSSALEGCSEESTMEQVSAAIMGAVQEHRIAQERRCETEKITCGRAPSKRG